MKALKNNQIYKVYSPSIVGVSTIMNSGILSISSNTSLRMLDTAKVTLSINARKTISQINSFRELEENWDSYGGEKPSYISIYNANEFVKRLDSYTEKVYFTSPNASGDIMIELKNEERSIELFFQEDDTVEYAFFEGNDCVKEDEFKFDEPDNTLYFINWLNKNK